MAPAFCTALQAGKSPESLAEFLGSSAGARGFFVIYLTGDEWPCADSDDVPVGLASSLEAASNSTIELMLMNVVMSAGTALAHKRAGRDEMEQRSTRTCSRATILVKHLWSRSPALREAFGALDEAVQSEFLVEAPPARVEVDEWVAFLARWAYDDEQLDLIAGALKEIKDSVPEVAE